MARRTVNFRVSNSSFVDAVSHNGRGVLTVTLRGTAYKYNAPISVADMLHGAAQRGTSVGKLYAHGVKNQYNRTDLA